MSNGPAIVIKGDCHFWPGGPRTLTALPADREPNSQTFWFSVRLEPGNKEVFFRIALEATHRMPENTPQGRGKHLVERLIAWIKESPDHQLEDLNDFQVYVSDAGDTRVEPYDRAYAGALGQLDA